MNNMDGDFKMFEIDIREAAHEGILLHDRNGKPYWKLNKICGQCDNDLGECLCFTSKGQMEIAKNTPYFCSAKCWYENQPASEKESACKHFRGYWERGETDLAPEEMDNYKDNDDPLFLELFFDWTEEWWSCIDVGMAEECGADMDCPI